MKFNRLKMLFQTLGLIAIGCGLVIIGCEGAFARDMASAAQSYTSNIKLIAQSMSVVGVIAGGLLMQIPGVAMFGKGVLSGGLVGSVCSFGAPALQSFLTTIFGGG